MTDRPPVPAPSARPDVELSRRQVRAIDRLCIERYGIPGILLMENAGRNAAEIIRVSFGPVASAVVFCGAGNNGGDGCVIARHLHNVGWPVRLVMTGLPDKMTADTRMNFAIAERMELVDRIATDALSHATAVGSIRTDELVVDALLGTGFSGEVRSPTAELIDRLNAAPKRAMVAVDVPSGLDCDTGSPAGATIRADLTITFVARKRGFSAPAAAPCLGRVAVADIGSPPELLQAVRVDGP